MQLNITAIRQIIEECADAPLLEAKTHRTIFTALAKRDLGSVTSKSIREYLRHAWISAGKPSDLLVLKDVLLRAGVSRTVLDRVFAQYTIGSQNTASQNTASQNTAPQNTASQGYTQSLKQTNFPSGTSFTPPMSSGNYGTQSASPYASVMGNQAPQNAPAASNTTKKTKNKTSGKPAIKTTTPATAQVPTNPQTPNMQASSDDMDGVDNTIDDSQLSQSQVDTQQQASQVQGAPDNNANEPEAEADAVADIIQVGGKLNLSDDDMIELVTGIADGTISSVPGKNDQLVLVNGRKYIPLNKKRNGWAIGLGSLVDQQFTTLNDAVSAANTISNSADENGDVVLDGGDTLQIPSMTPQPKVDNPGGMNLKLDNPNQKVKRGMVVYVFSVDGNPKLPKFEVTVRNSGSIEITSKLANMRKSKGKSDTDERIDKRPIFTNTGEAISNSITEYAKRREAIIQYVNDELNSRIEKVGDDYVIHAEATSSSGKTMTKVYAFTDIPKHRDEILTRYKEMKDAQSPK